MLSQLQNQAAAIPGGELVGLIFMVKKSLCAVTSIPLVTVPLHLADPRGHCEMVDTEPSLMRLL